MMRLGMTYLEPDSTFTDIMEQISVGISEYSGQILY